MTPKIKKIVGLTLIALKGKEQDYTKGSLNTAIFMLSVPMIAEMMMESLFAVVDVFFVSKVSVNAVATVGITESVLMIIYSIAIGLCMAVTAVVSRRIGEKNPKKASEAAFQSIILSLGVGIIFGVLGYYFAEEVLLLMGADHQIIHEGIGYTQIMYAGNLSILLLFLHNGIFRGAGDAAIAMKSLWIANGCNIILDPILIFGVGFIPGFGVTGAAIATTLGRFIGVFYQLYYLLGGASKIKLGLENIKLQFKLLWELIKISFGGIWQFLIESASWIFMVRIVSLFGAQALAGYTIAFRIIVFTLLPSWGLANAAATLVGQNLGANKSRRAEKSVWKIARYNAFFLIGISAVFFVFSESLLAFFTQQEAVAKVGKNALQIICCGYIFFGYGMVMGQAFNGSGDTKTPMFISIVAFLIIQIPISYVLSVYLGWESNGIFFSIAFSHTIYAIIAIFLFKKGKWKDTKV